MRAAPDQPRRRAICDAARVRLRIWSLTVLAVLCGFAACGESRGRAESTPARAASTGVVLHRIGNFAAPVYVTQAPGDPHRLFVVEQAGRIQVLKDGHKERAPFLDIHQLVTSGGEEGLLSVAFPPDYQTSGRFYVFYTGIGGNEQIVEYRRASADRANPHSARRLIFITDPEGNHNGGLLLFGPDNLLYIGIGDGGGEYDQHGRIGNGQNRDTLFGKLLRIDPHPSHGRPYTIPKDNPFVGRRGVRPEIYAWGLRNPWRFSFDRATGDIAIGDVGQDHVEEVDFRKRGGARGVNFGWRAFEGTRVEDPTLHIHGDVKPVLEYTHVGGNCAVTGGYVIRDPRLPALAGRYIYGDYCVGNLMTAHLQLGHATGVHALGLNASPLSSFGEDDAGRIYVVSLSGPVYRLDPR
jgi:glucose/arabinose dehydrogenase